MAKGLLTIAFCAALGVSAIGLLMRGPRPWVKRLTALTMVLFVVRNFAFEGPLNGVISVLLPVLAGVGAMAWATSRWRAPAALQLVPAGERPWPAHAMAEVERWTAEFELLGARRLPDQSARWQYGGDERATTLRMLHGPEGRWVAVISASETPKTVGRTIRSGLRDGRTLLTADQNTNTSLFRDEHYVHRRLPRGASSAGLLRAHERMVAGDAVTPVGDVPSVIVADHDAWVERLTRSGQARVVDGWMRVEARAFPYILKRQVAAWLS